MRHEETIETVTEAIQTVDDTIQIINTEELFEKAKKLAAFSITAAITGNTISIFAMLILQRILAQQAAVNPVNNLANIITISNTIAVLNTELKIIPTS